jgi:hypothetical protein
MNLGVNVTRLASITSERQFFIRHFDSISLILSGRGTKMNQVEAPKLRRVRLFLVPDDF